MKKPGAFKTAINAYRFLWENRAEAVRITVRLLPFFAVYAALKVPIYMPSGLPLSAKIAAYLLSLVVYMMSYSALAIEYYRLYLGAPQGAMPMSPLTLGKAGWQFVGKNAGYFLLMMLVCYVPLILSGGVFFVLIKMAPLSGHPRLMAVGAFLAIIAAIVLVFVGIVKSQRVLFYFPAKATGGYLSFRESYRAAKGLGGKLLGSCMTAWLPAWIIVLGCEAAMLPKMIQTHMQLSFTPGLVAFFILYVLVFCFVTVPAGILTRAMYYRWWRDNAAVATGVETTAA